MDPIFEARVRKETGVGPDHALGGLTLGVRTIMHAKHIILIAKGAHKAEMVEKMLRGPVTEDIPARKTKMIELGDAFIAFPGGTGTLEEITEVISKLSLGQLDAPCILYDLNGYYQPLHQLLQQMITMGLSTPARQRNITFAADLAQIRAILEK